MKGFPKHINTKQDVLNLLSMSEYAAQAKINLKQLVDNRFAWFVGKTLATGEIGKEDATNKIIIEEQDGKQVRKQMELKEDPVAQLFQIGLSVAEAEGLIK